MSLTEIWTEEDLTERLHLKIGKTGRCRTITKWIGDGLDYMEIYKRRFFLDKDVAQFVLKFKKSDKA